MAIKPILFNTEMVRAILDGRKMVTRRVCKDGNDFTVPDMSFYDADRRTYAVHNYADKEHRVQLSTAERSCPICPGDMLYVRETYCPNYFDGHIAGYRSGDNMRGNRNAYKADYHKEIVGDVVPEPKWRPSIHMPKEAARIWLKVTAIRVERLQDITEEQANAEGISEEWAMNWWEPTYYDPDSGGYPKYRDTFAFDLWDTTIKKADLDRYGWDANPWVWVIEFERCE
ncbi:MAG TPA: hypothetical protein H9742_14420 [Candidatus Acetatifactor stercoripullorum]|uniref:ASCH domain-containing protein n=1 Tax=Candidatus Acetatifactor stercoripullorum TaxID=2838414 RepID=A0A9D1UCF8_9FIRM|nr:hypothetical protein [Candidatus Acetatifactor stercoripullorum]